jgi:hypothetical protein
MDVEFGIKSLNSTSIGNCPRRLAGLRTAKSHNVPAKIARPPEALYRVVAWQALQPFPDKISHSVESYARTSLIIGASSTSVVPASNKFVSMLTVIRLSRKVEPRVIRVKGTKYAGSPTSVRSASEPGIYAAPRPTAHHSPASTRQAPPPALAQVSQHWTGAIETRQKHFAARMARLRLPPGAFR